MGPVTCSGEATPALLLSLTCSLATRTLCQVAVSPHLTHMFCPIMLIHICEEVKVITVA